MLSSKLQGHLDRVLTIADKGTAMKELSGWMTRNLRLNDRPYSFKDHEMHIAIAADQHPHKAIKKPSQVGLTELSLRIVAAIAAVTRSEIIYVFPSADFSEKVSASRFLPIVKGSPILAAMQHTEVKSAAMRKLGNSTIYFKGASGTNQTISIPATHLIFDEEDFCSPKIIKQFNARLRHNEPDPVTGIQGFRQRFSTPTVPNYGVSKHVDMSDQKLYMVQCSKCNTHQWPSYYEDYVIPGYDGAMEGFDKLDLHNPRYRVAEAYIKCSHCGKDLWQDLLNPDRRQWVAKYPERTMLSGYQVSPIDVPKYNTVPGIFWQLEEYSTQDHRNIVLGLEHEDENNSFLKSIFKNRTDAFYMDIEEAKVTTLSGAVMGIDIGKIAHYFVGIPVGGDLHILNAGTLDVRDGLLALQIQPIINAYNVSVTVLDAGPDFSTPQTLIEDNLYGEVFGCQYARSVPGAFTDIDPRPEEGVVKAGRSATISDTMQFHNKGRIHYPARCEEMAVVKEHLDVLKKVVRKGPDGDITSYPKPDKPDHYAHALNYIRIAYKISTDSGMMSKKMGVPPGVSTVAIGANRSRA